MNFWAPKPKCHYPSTHSGAKDDENSLLSCHSGCFEAVGMQQTLTDSGSSGPCVPHFPVCSCPLSFPSAMSPVHSACFFPCYSVLPNTPMSRHLSHHCGGNICFRYELRNYFHAPEVVCIFVLTTRTEPRHVTAMHHRLSLQNRSLSDSPPSTGRLLETQYCPISTRTPQ